MSDPFKKVLYHLPLERYKERYTEWLKDVEQKGFLTGGLSVVEIEPSEERSISVIKSGSVLDSMQRSFYCLEQVRCLLMQLENDVHKHPLTKKAVYLSDMFTPGIEALFYNNAFDSIPVFAFCWAQTVDVFDFTYSQHLDWMRNYERMVLPRLNTVFVASSELLDRCIVAFPEHRNKFTCVQGLPFSVVEVFKLANVPANPVKEKLYHVVYSSRFDDEKNPKLFLDVVEKLPRWVKTVVCTGAPELRGNKTQVERAKKMARMMPNFDIMEDLTKEQYYTILRQSFIIFNTAFQDWVSFTLLEALSFGCVPVYPMYRSFPEALDYDPAFMYRFRSAESAVEKILAVLQDLVADNHVFKQGETLKRSENVMTLIAEHIAKELG